MYGPDFNFLNSSAKGVIFALSAVLCIKVGVSAIRSKKLYSPSSMGDDILTGKAAVVVGVVFILFGLLFFFGMITLIS